MSEARLARRLTCDAKMKATTKTIMNSTLKADAERGEGNEASETRRARRLICDTKINTTTNTNMNFALEAGAERSEASKALHF